MDTLKEFTIKNVKSMMGHEGVALRCDLYLNNKKVAHFYDDASGGESDINFITKEDEQAVANVLNKHNYAQYMFDNGWEFMETPSNITFYHQVDNLVDELFNATQHEKEVKRLMKLTEKYIVYGNEESGFATLGYKKPLKEIVTLNGGLNHLQNTYNKVKANLKEGERILNTNLKDLGVQL